MIESVKKNVFKMPKQVTIAARTSSITNAFVNGIIPLITPKDEEVIEALKVLNMTEETVCCAYCGDSYTEWDHFHPLIKNKRPTGYISEIHNLVPACGKCNQSKGNNDWRTWMSGDAARSPKSRKIPDLEERIQRLAEYERRFPPIVIDFERVVGKEKWERHWDNCEKLHKMMYEAHHYSDELKKEIHNIVKKQ